METWYVFEICGTNIDRFGTGCVLSLGSAMLTGVSIFWQNGHVVTTTDCYRRTRQFVTTSEIPKEEIPRLLLDPPCHNFTIPENTVVSAYAHTCLTCFEREQRCCTAAPVLQYWKFAHGVCDRLPLHQNGAEPILPRLADCVVWQSSPRWGSA